MQYAGEVAVKGMTDRPPKSSFCNELSSPRIGAARPATLLCSAGGRRPGRLNEHALEAA
jgi:hypothetical protein